MATFYNQATLSYNGNVTVSNITAGEILDVVSASKTPLTETYSQGADIAYAISVLNTGTTDLTGLTVTDDLGSYSFGDPASELVPLTYVEDSVKLFVNGTLQAAPTVSTADGLTFSGISVPAGGSAIIMYEAAVNQYAPFGTGANEVALARHGIGQRRADLHLRDTEQRQRACHRDRQRHLHRCVRACARYHVRDLQRRAVG